MKKKPANAMIALSLVYQAIREHNEALGKQLDNKEIDREEYLRATFPPLAIPTIQKKVDEWYRTGVYAVK